MPSKKRKASKRSHSVGRTIADLASQIARTKAELSTLRERLARKTRPGAGDLVVADSWKWAQALLEKRRPALMAIEGVVGCALGFRTIEGVETGEPCITVYVERKWKRGERGTQGRRRIPGFFRSGKRRIDTDVVEMGEVHAQSAIFAGSSIGPSENPPGFRPRGTLGAYGVDLDTGSIMALTAMHVMNLDQFTAPPGSTDYPVYHPSLADRPPHAILGYLIQGTRTGVDAAKIELLRPEQAEPSLPLIGPIRGWRPTVYPGDRGTPVRIYGAVSGFSSGRILNPAAFMSRLRLDSAIVVDIATQGGDSGCALVDPQNLVLGLLVGQSDSGARIFCSISVILDRLRCEILTQEMEAAR